MNVFVALFACNFLNHGADILLVGLVLMLFSRKRLHFTWDILLLMVFSVFYYVVTASYFKNNFAVFSLPIAYIIGLNRAEPSRESARKLLLLLAVFTAVHGFLNLSFGIFSARELDAKRLTLDIWTGQVMATTGQMTNYTLLASLAGFLLLCKSKGRLLLLILCGLAAFHTIFVGGRTILVLFGLSIAIGLIVFYLFSAPQRRRRAIPWLILSLLLTLAAVSAYESDLFGIQSFFESSGLYERFFSDYAQDHNVGFWDTRRWELKGMYLKLALDYPFGGGKIVRVVGNYAHDLWFDILDNAGIIPFLLILLYTLRMLFRLLKYIWSPHTEHADKILFASYAVCIFAQFFVEPILQGSPIFLAATCMIDGMLSSRHFNSTPTLHQEALS